MNKTETNTTQQTEKERAAAEKKRRAAEAKAIREREKEIKSNLMFYTRTVPGSMALNWLTEGAKKDLGITKDDVVLFNYEKGNLSIGLLPNDTASGNGRMQGEK